MNLHAKTALILVDLQNDFCLGGALAVPGADDVISLANTLQSQFDVVIATKDWHPADHASFASNQPLHKVGEVIAVNGVEQILWPDHCVQGTHGAEFHPELDTSRIKKIFYKGTDKMMDSYSAFFDNAHLRSTGLADYLKSEEVETIYVMGLATDYCVRFTCLDAITLGFKTYLIEGACRGVELSEGDIQNALNELVKKGVVLIGVDDVIAR
jgi:nicotinamidase/pyrazinamidase